MRIVIADDTALVRDGLARLLQDEGFDVCRRAENAQGFSRLSTIPVRTRS